MKGGLVVRWLRVDLHRVTLINAFRSMPRAEFWKRKDTLFIESIRCCYRSRLIDGCGRRERNEEEKEKNT